MQKNHPRHGRHMRMPHHFPTAEWHGRRRFIFPFALFFGGTSLIFITGIGVVIYLVLTEQTSLLRGTWLPVFCGVPLIFVSVAYIVGSVTFRRFGRPMSDIFSAIDSVVEGDLSVRVRENYPREIGRFTRRFNFMISELERAEQQRRNLTADIAHELRTPLHIIQGNLEGMLDGVYEPTTDNLTSTLDETKLLSRLVQDLQVLSLAEAGQLPLHPTRFLLADLIHDLASSFAPQASTRGISLTTKVADASAEITADYDRLNQVLSNLIANAVHHCGEGATVSIETEDVAGGARILVHDDGPGIPTEDLPFIFDRFWRGDRSRAREGAHSGLGLAIAKQLVHAHGGTIEVASDVGSTTFTVTLPEENAIHE